MVIIVGHFVPSVLELEKCLFKFIYQDTNIIRAHIIISGKVSNGPFTVYDIKIGSETFKNS